MFRSMQRGDEARLALIDAAMREASRIGLAALTLAPVAERAGWSKGGLLRHFPNKEALQLAVVHRTTELFRERVLLPALSSPAGLPRLRSIFRNWLGWIADTGLEGGHTRGRLGRLALVPRAPGHEGDRVEAPRHTTFPQAGRHGGDRARFGMRQHAAAA
jgi:AcrR family transcriptional regulator